MFIQIQTGTVEFYFHPVQKRIRVGHTGSNLVQRIDHFNNIVQLPFRQYQAQVSRRRVQGRTRKAFCQPPFIGTAPFDQIPEALQQHASA